MVDGQDGHGQARADLGDFLHLAHHGERARLGLAALVGGDHGDGVHALDERHAVAEGERLAGRRRRDLMGLAVDLQLLETGPRAHHARDRYRVLLDLGRRLLHLERQAGALQERGDELLAPGRRDDVVGPRLRLA